ncbi:MAG: alpha/beta fold hydrolase [Verrucomicrobiota bacterium]
MARPPVLMLPLLSTPLERLRDRYEVVVVGSGYGGAIAASRLARAGRSVCLLERGRELRPGEFPDSQLEAAREMQWDSSSGHRGSRVGLFDFRLNPEMNVLVGCGLGGTSLINANVSLRAEQRVLEDPRWPAAIRRDGDVLEEAYRRAEEMLRPIPYPADRTPPRKLHALEASARAMGARCYRPPINVTFDGGVNNVGVEQPACTGCGDCVTGCNVGAKNTTVVTYLADAVDHGAELFTLAAVRRVERGGGAWFVHFEPLESGRERFRAPSLFLAADVVVLGAGALGSTEILLRSKAEGLPLSDRVGERFSGNGDVLGFGYNNDSAINGVGFGTTRDGQEEVGPTITGVIDLREQPKLDDGFVIEDGAIPSGLAAFMPAFLAGSTRFVGVDTDRGDATREAQRELESVVRGARRGAVHNTQTYLVMAHDDGAGRMRLEDDRVRISWPGVGRLPIFEQIDRRLREATAAHGGTYLKNPLWTRLTGRDLITVHPLGGCVMAERAEDGVVDHRGRVFSSGAGHDVYDGLLVVDGATIPRPLGVNPLLTISAVAERAVALLARERGWNIDYAFRPVPMRVQETTRVGLRFTERMVGTFSTEGGEESPLEFTVTVVADDLDALVQESEHRARLFGTVTAPALSADPLMASDGEFQLFVADEDRVSTRQMRYRMRLTSEEGRTFFFHGRKVIRDDPGFDLWGDTTTLHLTVYDGPDDRSTTFGHGVLRIDPRDFLRQLRTMEVTGAPSLLARLRGQARFGRFFAGILFDTYGGVFARSAALAPAAPVRKRRELRAPAPEVRFATAEDGVQVRLTRYPGGERGPVVLAHGLGTSSEIFTVDTVETSLTEFLVAAGYDVWLLDLRTSSALSRPQAPSTLDDLAVRDWPAALMAVRDGSGREDVQVFGHCLGATTALCAVLAGAEGVRSIVAASAGLHLVVPRLERIKGALRAASVARVTGMSMPAAFEAEETDRTSRAWDRLLKLHPIEHEERCSSVVCRRATFLYGIPYEHDRLNPSTHDTVHEFFGAADQGILRHVRRAARRDRLVTANGADAYLPLLGRLTQPILFVHGAEDAVFSAAGTRTTYEALLQHNPGGSYALRELQEYGHLDPIIGKDAAGDVFPIVLDHLERTGATAGRPGGELADVAPGQESQPC